MLLFVQDLPTYSTAASRRRSPNLQVQDIEPPPTLSLNESQAMVTNHRIYLDDFVFAIE